jgi:hypothetical protein
MLHPLCWNWCPTGSGRMSTPPGYLPRTRPRWWFWDQPPMRGAITGLQKVNVRWLPRKWRAPKNAIIHTDAARNPCDHELVKTGIVILGDHIEAVVRDAGEILAGIMPSVRVYRGERAHADLANSPKCSLAAAAYAACACSGVEKKPRWMRFCPTLIAAAQRDVPLRKWTPLKPDVLLECFFLFAAFCEDVASRRLASRSLARSPSLWSMSLLGHAPCV